MYAKHIANKHVKRKSTRVDDTPFDPKRYRLAEAVPEPEERGGGKSLATDDLVNVRQRGGAPTRGTAPDKGETLGVRRGYAGRGHPGSMHAEGLAGGRPISGWRGGENAFRRGLQEYRTGRGRGFDAGIEPRRHGGGTISAATLLGLRGRC